MVLTGFLLLGTLFLQKKTHRMRSSIVPPGIQFVNVNASHMKFGTGQLTATHMKNFFGVLDVHHIHHQ